MGKNKHSICHCEHCVGGRTRRQEMNHGGIEDDYEDLVPYRKKRRRGRRSKACAKSKTNEKCDYSATQVIGTESRWNAENNRWVNTERRIKVCSRCGKHDWGSYKWDL